MSAVYGVWLLAFAAITFAWAYGQYRRPRPAVWTEWEIISGVVVLTVIGAAAMGAGFMVRAIADWNGVSLGLAEIGLIAIAVAAVVPAVRMLLRPAGRSEATPVRDRGATVHPIGRHAPDDLTEPASAQPPRDPTKPGHGRKAA